ncbi:MAG: c-type cytochrome [Planctomycetota bacterium]|nr:c-type cytochrome [Planctomycetota bacterium]
MWRPVLFAIGIVLSVNVMHGQAPTAVETGQSAAARRGYELLRTKPYLPADFDQDVFDSLWKSWPKPLQETARAASVQERRRLTMERYGLMPSPDAIGNGRALGYVDDGKQGWVMNCLACHGGKVAGQVIPGLGNSHFALQTLTEDVRITKLFMGKKLSHLDGASLTIPLGTTAGTTNSVIFGVVLAALRDTDMNVDRKRPIPELKHHDLDAPPLWNVKKKTRLYADGFAPKNHRVLMQFMMLPRNDAGVLRSWEADFQDILAWMESLESPKYPWKLDETLVARGKVVFDQHCAKCHGTYGKDGRYLQKVISIDVIGTDRRRLDSLNVEHRQWMKDGWLSRYGADRVDLHPAGYVAPPLDGVWASAPYLHNGSVPTLWHILHPDQRPSIWRRTIDGYDQNRGGIEIQEIEALPVKLSRAERRMYFDTSKPGKSSDGHTFPNALSDSEKREVLEYLKSL